MGKTDHSESPNKAETRCLFVIFFFIFVWERKEKEKNKETNWFCHFIHSCALISPHITAAEDQAGAAARAFCCLSGLAANHAHTVAVAAAAAALWERSSSSEAGRRALYWPPWLSAESCCFFFSFFLQAKCAAITKFLTESAAIYDFASCQRRPQVGMRRCGGWRMEGWRGWKWKSEVDWFWFFSKKTKIIQTVVEISLCIPSPPLHTCKKQNNKLEWQKWVVSLFTSILPVRKANTTTRLHIH